MASAHPVSPCWVCESPCHSGEMKKFSSPVQFQAHMWEMHKGTYSAESLCYLTRWCKREPNQLHQCFLCLQPIFAKDAIGSMQDVTMLNHFAEHFQTLASRCQDAIPRLSEALRGHNATWMPSEAIPCEKSASQSRYNLWIGSLPSRLILKETTGMSKTSEKRPQPQRVPKAKTQLLACPFYKWEPGAYFQCGGVALATIPLLQDHLQKCHSTMIYCRRCHKRFDSVKDRDLHIRDLSCAIVDGRAMGFYDEIDAAMIENAIAVQANPRITEEEQWNIIFALLFPHYELPHSPYADSIYHLQRSMSESSVPRPSRLKEAGSSLDDCVSESDASDVGARATSVGSQRASWVDFSHHTNLSQILGR